MPNAALDFVDRVYRQPVAIIRDIVLFHTVDSGLEDARYHRPTLIGKSLDMSGYPPLIGK